jgi:uncharacterized membrane protein YedE/YeeE
MARLLVSVAAGFLFGVGLVLSGMTQPSRVLAFLDPLGAWDPTLLFVLGGAVGVTLVAFRFVLRRPAPVLAARFRLPESTRIDRPLVAGAVLFGVGWGITGYCPGPGVALLAAPTWETWVFLPAMLAGMVLDRGLAARRRGAVRQESPMASSAPV